MIYYFLQIENKKCDFIYLVFRSTISFFAIEAPKAQLALLLFLKKSVF